MGLFGIGDGKMELQVSIARMSLPGIRWTELRR